LEHKVQKDVSTVYIPDYQLYSPFVTDVADQWGFTWGSGQFGTEITWNNGE